MSAPATDRASAVEVAYARGRADGLELGQRLARIEAQDRDFADGYQLGFEVGREVGYGQCDYEQGRTAESWDRWYKNHEVGTGTRYVSLMKARAHLDRPCACGDCTRYADALAKWNAPLRLSTDPLAQRAVS